ncbi:hypothetical protein KI688_005880 [Linnemannia hyalina]|uniref:Crinkler effector protein N-terminal domain-containing protein n=1 Tax=Linnemannia hyalina TaxID=64524 RepID=A0A9P8BZJ7_9FUNG|nr:hypothetical protein KI688_005880 [Linnemannia hyalina]
MPEEATEFPVDIWSSMTIGHLKDQIWTKNLHTFIGVDAKNLTLWRVVIPAGNLHSAITVDALDDDN